MTMERRLAEPAAPAPHEATEMFRLAMRRTGSSVCAVTTIAADGSRRGATVNSMTSVSMRPPSLLVSLESTARIHAAVLSRGRFALTVFAPHHHDIAAAFADPMRHDERFKVGPWRLDDGLPVLDDAVANLLCRVEATLPFATHTIVVGVVEKVSLGTGDRPLLYHDGRYGGWRPPDGET